MSRGGATLLLLALSAPAWAQPLVVGTPPVAAPPVQTCQTVTAGSAQSYACINESQRELVEHQKQALGASVPNANSPAPQLGLYNQAATREQYGSAFGHSVIPQRPPPPVYTNPLVPH